MSTPSLIFRILYSLLYFIFCLLLTVLVLISPADAISQAVRDTYQYNNVVIIAIVYLVTVLVVLFVYSLRLYITRTVLAGIPKQRIPIGKGDVGKDVRKMIVRELGRSAAIAWAARPKVHELSWQGAVGGTSEFPEEEALLRNSTDDGNNPTSAEGPATRANDERDALSPRGNFAFAAMSTVSTRPPGPSLRSVKKNTTVESEMGIALPPTLPVWGKIEHAGWGSPDSPDLPNLQYSTVVAELPNLIEAKAVSLVPSGWDSGSLGAGNSGAADALNVEAVQVLQRGLNMGMRDYVVHLTGLGVLPSAPTDAQPDITREISEYLDTYERARFSPRPLTNEAFRRLMHLFAELLRSMRPLDPSVLDTLDDMSGGMYTDTASEGKFSLDIDDDAPRDTRTASLASPQSSFRDLSRIRTRSFASSLRSEASRRSRRGKARESRPDMPARNSAISAATFGYTLYGTAPSTPKSIQRLARARTGMSTTSTRSGESTDSFAPAKRRPRSPRSPGGGSFASGQSRAGEESTNGSVIRLATRDDRLSGVDLPYVLTGRRRSDG